MSHKARRWDRHGSASVSEARRERRARWSDLLLCAALRATCRSGSGNASSLLFDSPFGRSGAAFFPLMFALGSAEARGRGRRRAGCAESASKASRRRDARSHLRSRLGRKVRARAGADGAGEEELSSDRGAPAGSMTTRRSVLLSSGPGAVAAAMAATAVPGGALAAPELGTNDPQPLLLPKQSSTPVPILQMPRRSPPLPMLTRGIFVLFLFLLSFWGASEQRVGEAWGRAV